MDYLYISLLSAAQRSEIWGHCILKNGGSIIYRTAMKKKVKDFSVSIRSSRDMLGFDRQLDLYWDVFGKQCRTLDQIFKFDAKSKSF